MRIRLLILSRSRQLQDEMVGGRSGWVNVIEDPFHIGHDGMLAQ
jgi:hypothetical protein